MEQSLSMHASVVCTVACRDLRGQLLTDSLCVWKERAEVGGEGCFLKRLIFSHMNVLFR